MVVSFKPLSGLYLPKKLDCEKGYIKMTTAHTTSTRRLITASNFVTRHPLLSFFGLSILLSWLLVVPSVL